MWIVCSWDCVLGVKKERIQGWLLSSSGNQLDASETL